MTARLYYLWFLSVVMSLVLASLTPRILALLLPY
jgi:hypothetical protein